MKVAINSTYGGFSLSDFAKKELGIEYDWDVSRTNPKLISFIEEHGYEACEGALCELKIVNVPDEATDWTISEYDGLEHIIYVLDGKLKSVWEDD